MTHTRHTTILAELTREPKFCAQCALRGPTAPGDLESCFHSGPAQFTSVLSSLKTCPDGESR